MEMQKSMDINQVIRTDVRPTWGCTEPGAIALAVARATRELPSDSEPEDVSVVVSEGIYKNGMHVGLPGTGGARGNLMAAALGALCRGEDRELETLCHCSERDVRAAEAMTASGRVRISLDPRRRGVDITATVRSGLHHATCTIRGSHTDVTELSFDGHPTPIDPARSPVTSDEATPTWLGETYAQVVEAVLGAQAHDASLRIARQSIRMNSAAAEQAAGDPLRASLPLTRALIARSTSEGATSDVGWLIRTRCTAAVEARMSGAPVHVMSSAGSGNAGITAVVPVVLLGESLGVGEDTVIRAVLLSHATTSYVKQRLGRVSPLCGCAVAAGAGAASGMAYLFGCGATRIPVAAQYVLANLGGMFCDGAKETCALKVGTAGYEAYLAACLAADCGANLGPQGILGMDLDETVAGLTTLAEKAMGSFDSVLISLLRARAEQAESRRRGAAKEEDRCFA